MLATVAALVIVLGLMVSLARHVRSRASEQLTKQLLAQLDGLIVQYEGRYKRFPAVPAFVPPAPDEGGRTEGPDVLPLPSVIPPLALAPEDVLPGEETLQANARLNNRAFVEVLRMEARRYPVEFAGLPPSFFVEGTLPDAWGTPIVFMPHQHPAVGMAMENRPFFVSAGPDRLFHTPEDNLFSYEGEGERK